MKQKDVRWEAEALQQSSANTESQTRGAMADGEELRWGTAQRCIKAGETVWIWTSSASHCLSSRHQPWIIL